MGGNELFTQPMGCDLVDCLFYKQYSKCGGFFLK